MTRPIGISVPHRRVDDDDDIQEYRRPWVGLTDEEILAVARDHYTPHQRAEISFARAIEAALRSKNT